MGGAGDVVWPFQGTRQEEQEERIGLIAEEQEELRGPRLRDETEKLLTQMDMSKEQLQQPAASAVYPYRCPHTSCSFICLVYAQFKASYTSSVRPRVRAARGRRFRPHILVA